MPSLHPTHPAYESIKIAEDDKPELNERFIHLLNAIRGLCLNNSKPDTIHPLWNELSDAVLFSENNALIETAKEGIVDTIGRLLWYRRPFSDEELTSDYQAVEIDGSEKIIHQLSTKSTQANTYLENSESSIYSADSITPEDLSRMSRVAQTKNRAMRQRDFSVEDLSYGKFVLANRFDFIFENTDFEGRNPADYIQSLLTDISGDDAVLPPYIGDNWLSLIKEMAEWLESSDLLENEESSALSFLINGSVKNDRQLEHFSSLAQSLPTVFSRHGYFAALSRFVFTPVLDAILPEGHVDGDASLAIDVYNLFSPMLLKNEDLGFVRDELLMDFLQGEFDIPEEITREFNGFRRPDLIDTDAHENLDNEQKALQALSIACSISAKYAARLNRDNLTPKIAINGPLALNGREVYVFSMACAVILDHFALILGESSRKFASQSALVDYFGSTPLESNETIFNGLAEAAFLSYRNYCDEYLAGRSDISLFDLSDILYRFHIIRESDYDHLVTESMSLGMVLSILTDPRFSELQYSWRNNQPIELRRIANPNEIQSNGWLRQRYLLDVIHILRRRELKLSADALLGYFLVTEVLVTRGELFFVDESMSLLGWATSQGPAFSPVSAGFCIGELTRIEQQWLARRVKEASRPTAAVSPSVAALIDDRAALYRSNPEEEASRVLGNDVLSKLPEQRKERVVCVFSEVQALIFSQPVFVKKDFGSAVMVFFRIFEDLLHYECREAYSLAAQLSGSGIHEPHGEPAFGNFIYLIRKVHSDQSSRGLRHALQPTNGFDAFYPTVQYIAQFRQLRNAAAHGSVIDSVSYWKFHDCLIHEGVFKDFVVGCHDLFSI